MSNSPVELRTAVTPQSSLTANLGALMGGHAVALLVPLLTVPYLARVLRPEGWAPVLVAQALASWVVLLLDYGFDLSGTRAVALARARGEEMGEIIWGVQSAKFLLVPLAALLLLVASFTIPALRQDRALSLWTGVFAIARGLNPLWYFQGLERVRGAIAIDTTCKVLGVLGVLLVVRAPSHGWRVLALQGCFAMLALLLLTWRMARELPPRGLSLRTAAATLHLSWTLFAFRASSTLYMQANTVILGLWGSPAAVVAYGGAEKVVRAAINLLEPATRVFLPRVSYLGASDPVKAGLLIQRSLILLGAAATAIGAALALMAPTVIALLLGAGYDEAVPVLRLLALLVPIIAVGTVLGAFWALPFGRDRAMLLVTAAAGMLNLVLVLVLVPRISAIGMAIAVVLAELLVVTTLGVMYARWKGTLSAATVSIA